MDVVEVLMTEHSAIRHISNNFKFDSESSDFQVFVEYLKKCHIEIEERVFVPVIKDVYDGKKMDLIRNVDRIMADHRLLETLASNIIKWKDEENFDILKTRVPLFFKLLQDHNNSEEDSLFTYWKDIEDNVKKNTMTEVGNIIESFGLGSYSTITGISKDFFSYVFR
ncbi:MAG: hemerythrin domain-containing protein [Candidatus Thermoplasmatota archaeon]|nr:hemerythrin domain-containing protein [Candidatus Thermoplasmatota archaeon]